MVVVLSNSFAFVSLSVCVCLLWAVLLLSSLGFWLRWWLALQTCFMWSCTMWTVGAWTWGGGSLWSRMADTSCVGIVSFWAPSVLMIYFSLSFYLPHLNPLLSELVTSCYFHKPSLFSPCPRHTLTATCISDLSHDHTHLDQKATVQVFNTDRVMCCTPSPPLSPSLLFSLSSLSFISEYG